MKKTFAILVTFVFLSSLVMAYVPTAATGGDGGSNNPVIKAKWERQVYESGLPYITPGNPVMPPMVHDEYVTVEYWAVVTDADGIGDLDETFAEIFHPDARCGDTYTSATECNADEYCEWDADECVGTMKYQIELVQLYETCPDDATEIAAAVAELTNADGYGLVHYNTGYNFAEVRDEIEECGAKVYKGTRQIHYHQPCGDYQVEVYHFDKNNALSERLVNTFRYTCVAGIELDFDEVDFESIQKDSRKVIYGDWNWDLDAEGGDMGPACIAGDGCRLPTIRNLGNVPSEIYLTYDDMGFGKTGDEWNVLFDGRLGENPSVDMWPEIRTQLPGVLKLCNTMKLSFSITPYKVFPGVDYTGSVTIEAVATEW